MWGTHFLSRRSVTRTWVQDLAPKPLSYSTILGPTWTLVHILAYEWNVWFCTKAHFYNSQAELRNLKSTWLWGNVTWIKHLFRIQSFLYGISLNPLSLQPYPYSNSFVDTPVFNLSELVFYFCNRYCFLICVLLSDDGPSVCFPTAQTFLSWHLNLDKTILIWSKILV